MSLINDIKTLRQDRAKLVEDAGKLLTLAGKEKRDLTDEETHSWDKMHADADALKPKIERLERQTTLDAELRERDTHAANTPGLDDRDPSEPENRSGQPGADQNKLYERSFKNYCLYGISGLPSDQRQAMIGGASQITSEMLAQMPTEVRALAAGTDTAGGFLVPTSFQAILEKAQLQFSGMLEMARLIDTATGSDLPWPTSNDTSNKGALLAENTATGEQNVVFGSTTIGAFTYTSEMVRVSVQLMQDSAINMDTELTDVLGERLGRILNEHATTGTGSGQPNGVVTASALGVTAAVNSAITFNELIDLKHSVDPAYRKSAKVGWMFNDSTLSSIKKLTDSQNRPLWQANRALGEPDTIDGDRFAVNQDMASIATVAKSVLYGDFSKYIIRRVKPVTLLRLTERHAEFLQVTFLAFQRWDGDLINAGTNPIKHLVHPL